MNQWLLFKDSNLTSGVPEKFWTNKNIATKNKFDQQLG